MGVIDKYFRSVVWSGEHNSWIVEIPDLPGCMCDGDTLEEAIKESKLVVQMWVETARDLGREIPSPTLYCDADD